MENCKGKSRTYLKTGDQHLLEKEQQGDPPIATQSIHCIYATTSPVYPLILPGSSLTNMFTQLRKLAFLHILATAFAATAAYFSASLLPAARFKATAIALRRVIIVCRIEPHRPLPFLPLGIGICATPHSLPACCCPVMANEMDTGIEGAVDVDNMYNNNNNIITVILQI
ncbi:hypothetical protein V8E54_000921, partial [Elaphomyces granulatus]